MHPMQAPMGLGPVPGPVMGLPHHHQPQLQQQQSGGGGGPPAVSSGPPQQQQEPQRAQQQQQPPQSSAAGEASAAGVQQPSTAQQQQQQQQQQQPVRQQPPAPASLAQEAQPQQPPTALRAEPEPGVFLPSLTTPDCCWYLRDASRAATALWTPLSCTHLPLTAGSRPHTALPSRHTCCMDPLLKGSLLSKDYQSHCVHSST